MVLRSELLRVAGTVAVVAAGQQVATGLRGVRGEGSAPTRSPNVDSEIRFYAGWYLVAGIAMRRAASNPGFDRSMRPLIETGWGLAFLSRCLSLKGVGRPDNFFMGLAALEAATAVALVTNPPPPAA
jgi:hypothetical protein